MIKEVSIACAGAGKTYNIISDSIDAINLNKKVLVLTYTTNNQREIKKQFISRYKSHCKNFIVKGLFQFLLEDLIRPYQRCINSNRISGINFNNSDPHKKGRYTIPGRKEKLQDGNINPNHYFTHENKVHTMLLSKLAVRICKITKYKPIKRIDEMFDYIYIDEVQDLVGWDYELIDLIINKSNMNIKCVGDFRQTIYKTALGTKQPLTSKQKIEKFSVMGFDSLNMNINRRSIQAICDFSHKLHSVEGYMKPISKIKNIPEEFISHNGVFIVKKSDSLKYIEMYKPVILRRAINSAKEFNQCKIQKMNFGESKGLGFNRVLIVPTSKYRKYLKGDVKVFDNDKTEESKNKLYVAITRAKYSAAFLIDDEEIIDYDIPIWNSDHN